MFGIWRAASDRVEDDADFHPLIPAGVFTGVTFGGRPRNLSSFSGWSSRSQFQR
jgi:hypothetical protein